MSSKAYVAEQQQTHLAQAADLLGSDEDFGLAARPAYLQVQGGAGVAGYPAIAQREASPSGAEPSRADRGHGVVLALGRGKALLAEPGGQRRGQVAGGFRGRGGVGGGRFHYLPRDGKERHFYRGRGNWQQLIRNLEMRQAGLDQVKPQHQVDFSALAHGRELRGGGFVALAHERIDGTRRQFFAHQRHEQVILLPVGIEGNLHCVFDTIRPLPPLLQMRCRAMTNVRTYLPHKLSFLYEFLQNVRNALTTSVKKNSSTDSKMERGPRTEQDEKFLMLATQVMKSVHISSERAFSLELGRGPDFISRIRRGIQSAPADAWDALFAKYPAARNITTTNVTAHGGGQAVGTIQGDNFYMPTTLEACQLELEQHKRDLTSLQAQNERLLQQVAMQTTLLESKDALLESYKETISLLRAGYNRPN